MKRKKENRVYVVSAFDQKSDQHLSIQVDRIVGRNQICGSERRTSKLNNRVFDLGEMAFGC